MQRGDLRDAVIDQAVLSVSEVRMSHDLRIATAFVAPLGANNDEVVIEALNRNARFIRGRPVAGAPAR